MLNRLETDRKDQAFRDSILSPFICPLPRKICLREAVIANVSLL